MKKLKEVVIVDDSDINRKPSLRGLRKCYCMVIKYNPAMENETLEWVEKFVDICLMSRFNICIYVYAKHGDFKDYEVPALIGKFNKLGAQFTNFDSDDESFETHIKDLEDELAQV